MTSDGVNSYTWDRANRLLTWDNGVAADLVNHAYDGEGRRVSQAVGTTSPTITKYLLDIQPGLAVVLSETTGANTMRYVHSPRGIHAHKDASNNWEWTIQDGLGSVREVVDNSVGVLESRNYDPYGNAFGATGSSQTGYGFTGELVDGSGLLDLRARRYNAGMGVFASLDPFEGMTCTPMSLNRYSWVEGNVPNLVDPSGMFGELPSMWDSCAASTASDDCEQQCLQVGTIGMFGGFAAYQICLNNCKFRKNMEAIALESLTPSLESIVKHNSLHLIVACDANSTNPTCAAHPDFSAYISMGTLTSVGILTHDHWGEPAGLPNGFSESKQTLEGTDYIHLTSADAKSAIYLNGSYTISDNRDGSVFININTTDKLTSLGATILPQANIAALTYQDNVIHCVKQTFEITTGINDELDQSFRKTIGDLYNMYKFRPLGKPTVGGDSGGGCYRPNGELVAVIKGNDADGNIVVSSVK